MVEHLDLGDVRAHCSDGMDDGIRQAAIVRPDSSDNDLHSSNARELQNL